MAGGDRPRDVADRAPGRKATIADIATATGLSKATISLVLRNSPTIPEGTRQRVREAASRLGYVYNRGAASLRSASTSTIGILVNDLTNPYFAETVAAIQARLLEEGRLSFLCNTGEDIAIQARLVEKLGEHRIDGLILSPAMGTRPEWLERVRATGLPLVLLSRHVEAGLDSVGPDNIGGMRLAMEHLVELGHRRIAFVGANERTSTGIERLEGYRKGLKVARLPADDGLIVACPPTRDAGFAAAVALMRRAEPPDAIAGFNDILAFGVMLGLRSLGLVPGRDVSVTGFDDIAEASLWRPALTTVSVPRAALADETARRLLGRIATGASRGTSAGTGTRLLLPSELVVRETTLARGTVSHLE